MINETFISLVRNLFTMFNKRGQVTVFVILGIVLVALVVFVLYVNGVFVKFGLGESREVFVGSQVEPSKVVVRDCVERSLVDGILFVSIQGGYFDPVLYETFGGFDISYACEGGVNHLPMLNFIGNEIAQFMNQDSEIERIHDCIGDGFGSIESRGVNVDYNFADLSLPSPNILNDQVSQDIIFSYSLKKGDETAQVNDLRVEVPSNLRGVYDIAVDVVNAECGGSGFDIDDYVWEHGQALDILAASIANGPVVEDHQPWYLESYAAEGNGQLLKFHFVIEQ